VKPRVSSEVARSLMLSVGTLTVPQRGGHPREKKVAGGGKNSIHLIMEIKNIIWKIEKKKGPYVYFYSKR
jgi:hypothetical protein